LEGLVKYKMILEDNQASNTNKIRRPIRHQSLTVLVGAAFTLLF